MVNNPHVSFAFGRLNPPHYGHEGLINTLSASAKKGAWALFLSKSHDAKKNPLTYDQKLKWVKTLYPQVVGHLIEDSSIRTFLQAAVHLYNKGFRSATFVAGEDDMANMRQTLERYNGVQMEGGYYKFEPLTFVESPRLTSATNARDAAASGDQEAFERATRVASNIMVDGKNLFQTVREGMRLGEVSEATQISETIKPTKNMLAIAKKFEDYANENIPQSEPGFGDFMYHAELIRKGHIDIHREDMRKVQSKYLPQMKKIIKDVLSEEIVDENEGFDQVAGIGIDGQSFKFKIRDLVAFAEKYPVVKINPNQFAEQIAGREEDPEQSMARAQKAELKYPIIVVKRKNGQLWIADGTHRAHKAILNKLPSIDARVIPIEDMGLFAVKKDVKETAELNEAATDVLYHYTNVGAALDILREKQFKLASSLGSVETQYKPKDYTYFLSTARSRVGGYHRYTGTSAVMFVLDGRWISQRYPVKAIDYWAGMSRGDRHSETEDRVFSKEPTMPATPILAIHVLLKEANEFQSPTTRKLLIAAKQADIPTYLYRSEEAWRLQDTRRSISIAAARDVLKGQEITRHRHSGTRWLKSILDLLTAKNENELGDRAKKMIHNVKYYWGENGRYNRDSVQGIETDFSNARKPGNPDYDDLTKIISIMRKNRIANIAELVNFIHKKWAPKSEGVNEDADASYEEDVFQHLENWFARNEPKNVVLIKRVTHANPDVRNNYYKSILLPRITKHDFPRIFDRTFYLMIDDLAKTVKQNPLKLTNEHENTTLGTVGGGATLTDRSVAVFPWDKYGSSSDFTESNMKSDEILSEEQLDEIRMNPKALQSMVKDIPNATAGLEFELIVTAEGDDYDYDDDYAEEEPDWDTDESIDSDSWDDLSTSVMRFFRGDYNPRSEVQAAIDDAQRDYKAWAKIRFTQWMNQPDSNQTETRLQKFIEERWGADPEYQEELFSDVPKISPVREFYIKYWDDWFEQMEDEKDLLSDWLRETDQEYMSGFLNRHTDLIQWPNYYAPDRGDSRGGGPPTATFTQATGMNVNVSGSYHGRTKSTTAYTIEPDSSLRASSNRGGEGWEFVSPPLPIDKMIDQIKKVAEWAKRGNAYTNRTTGLHMNISLPGFDLRNLDYVKLALFLGDEYVLEKFGRLGNTYADSAMKIIKTSIDRNPTTAERALAMLKENLNMAASRLIHGTQTNKFTSINTKDNRVEFRSPGGNWLDMDLDDVINTLLRTVVALEIAMDPTKQVQEYRKKFAKLLSANKKDDDDTIQYFTAWASGNLHKDALMNKLRSVQSKRSFTKGKARAEQYSIIKTDDTTKSFYNFNAESPYGAVLLAKSYLNNIGYSTDKYSIIKNDNGETHQLSQRPTGFWGAQSSGETQYGDAIYGIYNPYSHRVIAYIPHGERPLSYVQSWARDNDADLANLRVLDLGTGALFSSGAGRRVGSTNISAPITDHYEVINVQFLDTNIPEQQFYAGNSNDAITRGQAIADGNLSNGTRYQIRRYVRHGEPEAVATGIAGQGDATRVQNAALYQMRRSDDSIITQDVFTNVQAAIAAFREYANTNGIPLNSYTIFRPSDGQHTMTNPEQNQGGQETFNILSNGQVLHTFSSASQASAYQYARRWAEEHGYANGEWNWATVPTQPDTRQYTRVQQGTWGNREPTQTEIDRGYDISGNPIGRRYQIMLQNYGNEMYVPVYSFVAQSPNEAEVRGQAWADEHIPQGRNFRVQLAHTNTGSNLTNLTQESLEESFLAEINMSPSSLEQFALSDITKGMLVGFETEMIVPNLQNEDSENEEEDLDEDDDFPADSSYITRNSRITDFFSGGRGPNSRETIKIALEGFYENFSDYQSQEFSEYEETDEYEEKFQRYLKDEEIDTEDESAVDEARSNFRDQEYDEYLTDDYDIWERWLGMNDIGTMYDFYRYVNRSTDAALDWPYMKSGGDLTVSDLAYKFTEDTGYSADESYGYHGTERDKTTWIFEPDSSIKPNKSSDGGIELVSPPMPVEEALKALETVFTWAEKNEYYTNNSTGFHIGVSIPKQTMDNIDHLKVIMLLGDEYVLQRFDRLSSQWAQSSYKMLVNALQYKKAKQIIGALDGIRTSLKDITRKEINSLLVPQSDRYVSVNIKSNYIEFRGAGKNYFPKYKAIRETMLRYIRVISAAANPDDGRQDYHKKLYKLLTDRLQSKNDTIQMFLQYTSGMLSKEQLIDNLRRAKKMREPIAPIGTGNLKFTLYDAENDTDITTVSADNPLDAYRLAIKFAKDRELNQSKLELNLQADGIDPLIVYYNSSRPYYAEMVVAGRFEQEKIAQEMAKKWGMESTRYISVYTLADEKLDEISYNLDRFIFEEPPVKTVEVDKNSDAPMVDYHVYDISTKPFTKIDSFKTNDRGHALDYMREFSHRRGLSRANIALQDNNNSLLYPVYDAELKREKSGPNTYTIKIDTSILDKWNGTSDDTAISYAKELAYEVGLRVNQMTIFNGKKQIYPAPQPQRQDEGPGFYAFFVGNEQISRELYFDSYDLALEHWGPTARAGRFSNWSIRHIPRTPEQTGQSSANQLRQRNQQTFQDLTLVGTIGDPNLRDPANVFYAVSPDNQVLLRIQAANLEAAKMFVDQDAIGRNNLSVVPATQWHN